MIHMDKTLLERRETVSSRFIEILLAILTPPIAVLLNRGPGNEFLICIVLTILGWFPGIVYAMYVLFSEMKDDHIPESESTP